jgi:3-phenylpropionate/trans-cinnamate dioxygenase ferredoxin subunit
VGTVEVPASAAPAEGEVVAVTVQGRTLALATAEGRLYAFDDACPHQGCSLARGDVRGRVVRCFCHGGRFDLDTGEVLGGPPRRPLVTYRVERVGDVLRVELDGETRRPGAGPG